MGRVVESAGREGGSKEFWNQWNATFRAGLGGEWTPDEATRLRHETVLAWARSLALHQPAILDLCCGAGWLSEELRAFGSVTAVDIADEVVARAQERFPEVAFIAGDFYTLSLPADHFDIVVCVDGVSYVPDQPGFVRRMAERLKPGGYVILAAPNRFVWERTERQDARAVAPMRHWHSRKELKALVAPWFDVVRFTTVAPGGHIGVLRLVNSHKLDSLLGFGRSLVLLGQKRA
jgi:SAM-dependent methyltransferase